MDEKNVRLLDNALADFLAKRSRLKGSDRQQLKEIVCRLTVGLAAGDTCLPLGAAEQDLIARSGLSGKTNKPLSVMGGRLYTQRYLAHEKNLAAGILALIENSSELNADAALFESLFPKEEEAEFDWQRVAAEKALQHSFLVISGGPGTGKSSTVLKILALLQNASCGKMRIALAAPTGKAAKRLQEAINSSVQKLAVAEEIRQSIPQSASTIHRLLGVQHQSPFFRHHKRNSLLFDMVIIDEASMVDLALMAKLLAALAPGSRLILLGDKDQLASVESGTVLSDIISSLPGNTVELQKTYRFDTGIKSFAHAINRGDAQTAWKLMVAREPENVSLLEGDAAEYAGERYCRYMDTAHRARSLEEYKNLFQILHSFKILCALRHGSAGVAGLNAAVEQHLCQKGYDCATSVWYTGRPIMVSRNEYGLDLYNGDMGICLQDPENPGSMKVWFERTDGSLQGVLPGRLSSCETAYALTIHKSQGTEVGEVLVVFPEKESVLVTRELLYTAVTRAKKRVQVKSACKVFQLAVQTTVERHSGLGARLGGSEKEKIGEKKHSLR